MPILGLMHAEQFASERFKSVRRSVYYYYPNGQSPLMGILALLKDEVANDPEFKWYEKRMDAQTTTTVAISANNPLYVSVDATFATWTASSADFTMAQGTQYGLKVANVGSLRVSHIIKFYVVVAAVQTEILGRITNVDTANNRVAFIALRASGANLTWNSAAGVGTEVLVVGNANAEGQVGASLSPYNLPVSPTNYTQIFRTAFQITGTALKTSAKFDKEGTYPDQSEEASLNHMVELEKAFLFGDALVRQSGTNPAERYTGGILWFLRQWEAANSIYRGGTGAPAITSNTDDNKRIINLTDGYMTHKLYNSYLERAFRVTNTKANEKLVLCGSGALNVMNQLYESRACLEVKPPTKDTYGMDIVSHVTPYGQVWYKTHPLFNQNPTLRYSMLILDVNNLKYRYIEGRDTDLLTNRQPNNADYREDEWLTEAGLELATPESHMYIGNVLDFK